MASWSEERAGHWAASVFLWFSLFSPMPSLMSPIEDRVEEGRENGTAAQKVPINCDPIKSG